MDVLIFLVLFHGLYGYVLRDMPTNNSHLISFNVEMEIYTNEDKFIAKTIDGNIFVKQVYDSKDNTTIDDISSPAVDRWSVMWYVASFGGLIAFFLIVSCSEWCCRRNARTRMSRTNSHPRSAPVTPPPSYDQFAPPPYDSLNSNRNGEKSEYDVYVVPVHALGTILRSPNQANDEPPSYVVASDRQLPSPSLPPDGQTN